MDEKLKDKIVSAIEELDSDDMEETSKYVMRELVRARGSDLPFKTELDFRQIRGLVKLLSVDRIMKAQAEPDESKAEELLTSVPEYMTNLLMKLMVSVNRKGRLEFINAWIGNDELTRNRGMLERFIGGGVK